MTGPSRAAGPHAGPHTLLTLTQAISTIRMLNVQQAQDGRPLIDAIRVSEAQYRAFKDEAGAGDHRMSGGTILGIPLIIAETDRPLLIVAMP